MRISPISRYCPQCNTNKNNGVSFKNYFYSPPPEIRYLDINSTTEDMPASRYPLNSLKCMLQRPELLGEQGFREIGTNLFRDARLFEAEGNQYSLAAKQARKKFLYADKKNPGAYLSNKYFPDGIIYYEAVKETLSDGDTKIPSDFGVRYSNAMDVFYTITVNDGILKKVSSAKKLPKTGKTNSFYYYDSGMPEKVEIGSRMLPDGSKKIDKVFGYDEKGEFDYSALNVRSYPDGTVHMTDYVLPNDELFVINNLERYCLERTENPDGSVDIDGLFLFADKHFWHYFPKIKFKDKEEERTVFTTRLIRDDFGKRFQCF